VIETREELAHALSAAAELEHGLLLQYLFAAYSLEKFPAPATKLSAAQADQCRLWERRILGVARDEMRHLGTVCNLLSAIGESPQFRRPNFPRSASPVPSPLPAPGAAPATAEPSPFRFELTAFSSKTLFRFARAEKPEKAEFRPPPGGTSDGDDAVLFDYTGQLYRDIEAGFDRLARDLGEPGLFIGPRFAQDTGDWTNMMSIPNIRDGKTAAAAIQAIISQGEGSPEHREDSHFDIFEDLRAELAKAKFKPARPVVSNPRVHPNIFGAGDGTPITEPVTRDVASLSNSVYHTLLLMLMQYYSFSGENAQQLDGLREATRTTMSMAIRPIAEILTVLPVAPGSSKTAGPGFEIVNDLRLSTQLENRWTVLDERMQAHVEAAKTLAGSDARLTRLAFIADSLNGIATNLRRVAP
jgi:hypothetical protein